MRVLGIDGSPRGGGKTHTVLEAILRGAEADGAQGSIVSLAGGPSAIEEALDEIGRAEGFVMGSPVYRASYAAPLKGLLDRLPRGMWGETEAPLRGRAVAIAATGASLHHFLCLHDLRNVLASFFATHVVPPGLYVPSEGFDAEGSLAAEYEALASQQGRALVELASFLPKTNELRGLEPQA